jgi:D-amino peptidase
MMEGIESGHDAAFFVGYHARAGTRNAILDHTYTDRILDVRVNGTSLGELGLNALLAGTYHVPVALVSGDQALASEAGQLLGPAVKTVIVKTALSRNAARSLSPLEACNRIRTAAEQAVKSLSAVRPLMLPPPYALEVDFRVTVEADLAQMAPWRNTDRPPHCGISAPGLSGGISSLPHHVQPCVGQRLNLGSVVTRRRVVSTKLP